MEIEKLALEILKIGGTCDCEKPHDFLEDIVKLTERRDIWEDHSYTFENDLFRIHLIQDCDGGHSFSIFYFNKPVYITEFYWTGKSVIRTYKPGTWELRLRPTINEIHNGIKGWE